MEGNKIYIITVNYGTPHHTIECLKSIMENRYKHFQVLIIDVSNLNQSVDLISNWIETVDDERFCLTQISENRGFAHGCNVGIKLALENEDCEFIWLLNNDTIIDESSLTELVNCYNKNKKNKNVGIIGSKILEYNARDAIQNVGGKFNKWTGYSVLIGMGETDKGQYDNTELNPDYIVGASMFFHSSLVLKIGLLPENYFLYYEDIDWSITAKKAGLINITCTASLIYHKQGMSTGVKLLTKDHQLKNKIYLYRSYLFFYRRHYKNLIIIAYIMLLKQLAGKLFRGKLLEAGIIFKATFGR